MSYQPKRKIIIDTDPGVDDAFAIVTALKYQGFEVVGITTVAGNKGLDYVTKNALKLVGLLNADCMVYQGAHAALKDLDKPVDQSKDAGNTHGFDGLGGIKLPYDLSRLSEQSAVDYILATVEQYPNEVEIMALGPLTNIALAIQTEPELMKKVKTIWSMGGGVYRGNVTPVAEFNYWFDAESAQITYSIGQDVDIYMFGLDVTYQTYFTANDFFFIKQEGGELGRHFYDMVQDYADSYWNNRRITGAVIHDLVPVIYAIDPTISNPEDVYHCAVSVSCEPGLVHGQTVVDLVDRHNYPKNSYVVINADDRKFKEVFMEIVFGEVADLYKKYVVS